MSRLQIKNCTPTGRLERCELLEIIIYDLLLGRSIFQTKILLNGIEAEVHADILTYSTRRDPSSKGEKWGSENEQKVRRDKRSRGGGGGEEKGRMKETSLRNKS